MSEVQVAVVQHCAGTDVAANLSVLEQLSRAAAEAGAQIITWPEAFAYLGRHDGKVAILESIDDDGPILQRCRTLAQELQCELLLGGFHERHPQPSRCFNTSIYLGQDGQLKATYRKIHLFDVAIEDGPNLSESKHTDAGERSVTVDTLAGRMGLTVCYDLRFPLLYQQLVDQGATILTVPSAFTATTGAAHWHALLRARAIENQCYVIAPAQHGQHSPHRASYGHSLIIDPWGEILCEVANGDGYAMATIDPQRVADVRRQLPSLCNRRAFQP